MPDTTTLGFLEDLWDSQKAAALGGDQLSLLRYRSNLLGSDLRITNFGGGNTSTKMELPDPFTGDAVRVLAVKGSGGDLGSITEQGFALLYLDRLERLKARYRGEPFEDEMVKYYPLAAFGENRVAASIDTPLHAFISAPHVDHLHPDWAIALAASANGLRKLDEFNREYGRRVLWLPWQRPGFELALMIETALRDDPGGDGLLLGSHGLFTWGATPRDCYLASIRTIDQMGEFIARHRSSNRVTFGGLVHKPIDGRREFVVQLSACPPRRGIVQPPRDRTLHGQRRGPRRSPDRHGRKSSAGWAPAVPIIFCVREFAPCSSSGIRQPMTPKRLKIAIREQVARLPRRLPPVLRRASRPATLPLSAIRIHRSSSYPASGYSALAEAKKKRASRPNFSSTRSTSWRARRRWKTADRRRFGCRSRAEARIDSSSFTTTWRCRDRRRSASSTGRSKKPNCRGCPLKQSSAGRSC